MKSCKECEKLFDEEMSAMSFSELREISYDAKLMSDARDLDFCDKFCEKKSSDREWFAAGNSLSRGFQLVMGPTLRSKKRAGDVLAMTCGQGNEADIARDPVMMKTIMSGNPSDKGLNNAVTEMQKEKKTRARQEQRADQKKKIDTAKAQYRAKYGVEA